MAPAKDGDETNFEKLLGGSLFVQPRAMPVSARVVASSDRRRPSISGGIGQPVSVENRTRWSIGVWVTTTNVTRNGQSRQRPDLINAGQKRMFGATVDEQVQVSLPKGVTFA